MFGIRTLTFLDLKFLPETKKFRKIVGKLAQLAFIDRSSPLSKWWKSVIIMCGEKCAV
jgi:hypothetical protein